MWKTIEENIQVKVSGKDTERLIERKLNDFKLRLDGYICSQELETDIAELKQNPEIGDTLKDMSDFLSEKLLEFLEKEFVWKFIREKALFVCYILLFTSATLLFREWAVELVGGKGKSCRNG